jgi:hypothetical protein
MVDKLKILWEDGKFVEILLEKNPVADFYAGCVKRLQHVNLEFNTRHNPLDPMSSNITEIKKIFEKHADNLGINVDFEHLEDQNYLNELHDKYIDSHVLKVKDRSWFVFHDYLHLLEDILQDKKNKRTNIFFDYKGNAGPLIKKFDRGLLKYSRTTYSAGDCFITFSEKGKDLYRYFLDNEPNDIERMCKIAKPWLYLRPVLNLYVFAPTVQLPAEDKHFIKWLSKNRDEWCRYWNIDDWHPNEATAKIPIGVVNDIELIKSRFAANDYPKKISIN